MVKVKICGIKSVKDANKAIEYGADAIGLLVGRIHPSKDFITKELSKKIVDSVPPFCSTVMVTHLRDTNKIIKLAKYIGVNTIQLHGGSTITEIKKIKKSLPNVKIYRAFHVIDKNVLNEVKKFENYIDAVLLDSLNIKTGQVGGTGKIHDWDLSRKVVKISQKPVILAGGLNPSNVEKAIKQVKPFGIDINSGVKNKKGMKDYNKLKKFISVTKRF